MSNHLTPTNYEYMGHPLVIYSGSPPCGCKVYTCAEDIKRDHIAGNIPNNRTLYITPWLYSDLMVGCVK